MRDIFISHSSKDKPILVRKLVSELRSLSLDVWLDEDVILSGDNILEQIEKGIEKTLCVALILTPAFFQSNWTSLEIGLARAQKENCNIIPILSGIDVADIAQTFPFLLTQKYILLEPSNVSSTSNEIVKTIDGIKKRRLIDEPLDYQEAVRKLNDFDTPGSNTISILVTEYAQISKISIAAGIIHASKIGNAVINDIYVRAKQESDPLDLEWKDKLRILMEKKSGLNKNIIEHLSALMTINTNSYFSTEKDQKKLVDLSLAAILNWYTAYVSVILWKGQEKDHYIVVSPSELSYRDFVDMYAIDQLVLRSDLIATPDVTYQWYQYNIYTHIAVRSAKTGRIVGYFALLPVTNDLYNKIQSGDFVDNDLSTDCIRQYNMADFYKLYIAAVCVHPEHQNTSAFNRLYRALIEMMYELATDREVYITDIITEASTKQGEKLCKILGLQKLMDTNIGTELYTASLLPPSLRLNSLFGHKLIQFYQEKYDEMRDLF